MRAPSAAGPAPAIIALGSNLGDSALLLREAREALAGLAGAPPRSSSLWRTEPVDCPPGSPAFLNAVVLLLPRAGESPESLLDQLQVLEREFGRQPKRQLNEARPLDLDLIAWGGTTSATARLILPHPRATVRRFVLAPLAELAPDLILPGQSRTVRELLAALPESPRAACLGPF